MPIANERGQKASETLEFVLEQCCSCGIPFMLPSYKRSELLKNHNTLYCPNGHRQHYTGKSESEKLKETLEQEKQQRAKEHEVLQNRWLDALGEKNKLAMQLKRVHKGVCPCCNRTFSDLQRHFKSKHPELAKVKI